MAADLGDLYARLKLDTTSLDAAGAKVTGLGSIFGGLTSPLNLAAGAVAAVGVGSLAMAANFQQSTDRMAAQAGITQQQAQKIADAFLTTGGKVTFSAEQIVKAYGPVSGQLGLIAGHALNASQALGFMTTATDLAEATGKPLAETTAALAQVMQAYGIGLSGAVKASDLLYNVSRVLNIPISDLVDTVDKLHAKLGPLAPSLSDVSTLLVDVATHGLTGNRALLLVSAGMNTLLGGSKATREEVATLGLTLFDANGQFVGMQSVLAQLAPKLAGMTEEQRFAAEGALFGTKANKALDETLVAGLSGWDKAAKAADRLGTAHQGAQTATDNLKGALDRARTAVVDVLIGLGEKILPPVAAALGFISDHLQTILQVAGPLALALGAMWTVDHIWKWYSAAVTAIAQLVTVLTSGGGLQAVLARLFPNIAGVAAAGAGAEGAAAGGGAAIAGAGIAAAAALPIAVTAAGAVLGVLLSNMERDWTDTTYKSDLIHSAVSSMVDPVDKMLSDFQTSASATKTIDDAMLNAPRIALAIKDVSTSTGFTSLWTRQQSQLMEDLAKAIKNGTVKTPQDVRDFATAWENASNQSGTRILPDTKAVADALANLKKRWIDSMNKIISSFESAANTSASQAPIWNTLFHSITANLGTAAQQAARIIRDLGPQPAPAGSHVGGGNPWGAYAGTGQHGLFVPPGMWGIAGEMGPEPVFGGRTGATVLPNETLQGGIHVVNHFVLNGGDEALVQRVQIVVTQAFQDALLAARA